jgi:hypothetical protein
VGVADDVAVGLAIADAVVLGTAEAVALGLLGVLEQPATPMTATTAIAKRKPIRAGVRPIAELVTLVMVMSSPCPIFVVETAPVLRESTRLENRGPSLDAPTLCADVPAARSPTSPPRRSRRAWRIRRS